MKDHSIRRPRDNLGIKAEFQNVNGSVSKFGNVSCKSASIAWNPLKELQQSSFVLGFNSDVPQLNSSKNLRTVQLWEGKNFDSGAIARVLIAAPAEEYIQSGQFSLTHSKPTHGAITSSSPNQEVPTPAAIPCDFLALKCLQYLSIEEVILPTSHVSWVLEAVGNFQGPNTSAEHC
ncbi:hypothetical protein BC332_02711 [Capsicum chinense]|nr:hypothetical protein BC332_02711 [Capsicum chinense]